MKKNRWYVYLVLSLMVLITGCFQVNYALVKDSDPMRPSFEIYGGRFFRVADLDLSFVDFFYFEDETDTTPSKKQIIVWEVMSIGQLSKISKITYGEVPEGYKELMKPQQLRINQKYYMRVFVGDYAGGAVFEVVNKDGKLVVEIISKD